MQNGCQMYYNFVLTICKSLGLYYTDLNMFKRVYLAFLLLATIGLMVRDVLYFYSRPTKIAQSAAYSLYYMGELMSCFAVLSGLIVALFYRCQLIELHQIVDEWNRKFVTQRMDILDYSKFAAVHVFETLLTLHYCTDTLNYIDLGLVQIILTSFVWFLTLEIYFVNLLMYLKILSILRLATSNIKTNIMEFCNLISKYNLIKQEQPFSVEINKCSKEWHSIIKAIHLLNQTYGLTMVPISLSILFRVVKDLLEEYIFSLTAARIYSQIALGNALFTLLLLIFSISIISSCAKLTTELKNVALASFEMFQKLPFETHYAEHDSIYQDIIVFERFVHKSVILTAGGYFVIDSSLAFKMLGTIISYLIICLGFDKELIQRFMSNKISID
ncbi:unnamed protein product, partial [Phyllotreta striolata]